jgi:excinuclease ABC subunit A
LKHITVTVPLGLFVAVTGVSGSGKSTLVSDILSRALHRKLYGAKDFPAEHKEIRGMEYVDKVITIDQSPIGRTPRSNPATYTGVFTGIRDFFIEIPESRAHGFRVGHFSFNVKGGRCEQCQGAGVVGIEMQFLPEVYVSCESCNGRRYRPEILEVRWNGKNIADVLEMTIAEAIRFFVSERRGILSASLEKLDVLERVGLGYLKLGQPATTLSGGEAQRIKLATELGRRATGRTLTILDEPTTGLHAVDIKRLLHVLAELVDKGNSVLVIEHNLEVIKSVDWVIDIGPGGGDAGGEVVAMGTPEQIMKVKRSVTGQYLKKVLG